MTILVFPSSLEASVRYADEAHRWGQCVVGASSVDVDAYAARYDIWEKLPFIGEKNFFSALSALAERQKIDRIFTPHPVTFNFLAAELPSRLPRLTIIGDGPYKTEVRQIEEALERANVCLPTIGEFAIAATSLPLQFVAGLLLQMERLYGQCSREKALATCAIMASAVKGDVVEIGSLFGKSTYVLNRLASYYRIGATLAIDPWDLEISVQHDASADIQRAPRNWNWEAVHQGFLVNMLSCACPPCNYMRTTSARAFARYCATPEVTSPEFGTTSYSGSIAALHIDGNHDEAAVAEDFDLWSRRLAPGAWIIFDDYNWPHGDGPRKIADRAIVQYGARVQRQFLAGGALFIKLNT
jgi:hypothetical protein